MIKQLKKIMVKYQEQISYLFFGGLTTLVNWITYTVIVGIFKGNIEIANVAAWLMAVLFAYVTNRKYVFKSSVVKKQEIFAESTRFFGARVLSGLVEIFGFPALCYIGLGKKFMGIEGLFAKILVSVVVIILNYILSKWIVFRKEKGEKQ